MKPSRLLPVALALVLAGCSKKEEPALATAPVPTATQTPAAAGSIDAPIPKNAIATRLELVGQPVFLKAENALKLRVRVVNQGHAALVSKGKAPVNLGVMLVGPAGPDQPPGKRDFVRFELPLIAPGASAEVEGKVPADAIIDLPVRLELVQEGVTWFAAHGQPSLDIGPFRRCGGDKQGLCDAQGKTLAAE